MANQDTKTLPLPGASPMVGGDGPGGYCQNSSFQKGVMDGAKGKIKEGIMHKLDLKCPNFESLNPFRIADLGCSVGPNTFLAVENIIEAVNLKYSNNSHQLEFQVFFNDVTSNDFNTLFRSIPSPREYFAAGVPGSFYGRLFPNSYLHIAYSCYSVHWLSKAPGSVVDRNSAAWNKDSIYCDGDKKEVAEAYLEQYRTDMDTFLNVRAAEIVEGGLLMILVAGRPDGIHLSQTSTGLLYHLLGSCLVDLAKSGVLNEEKVESFNLPLYYASPKEIEEIIEGNEYFSLASMETMDNPLKHLKRPPPQFTAANARAVFEGLFRKHFEDEDQVDKIFQHFFNKVSEKGFLFDEVSHKQIELFIVLKRNTHLRA